MINPLIYLKIGIAAVLIGLTTGGYIYINNLKDNIESLKYQNSQLATQLRIQRLIHKVKNFEHNQSLNIEIEKGKPYDEINTSVGIHHIFFK